MKKLKDNIADEAEILNGRVNRTRPWANCPECGSSDVAIVVLQDGVALSAGLGCRDCGSHTAEDINP